MKKSNVFLLLGAGLAIAWTTLTGVMYSTAINRDMAGKKTLFIMSHTQALEKYKKVLPAPENMLIISGDNMTSVKLSPGADLVVKTLPSNAEVTFSTLNNGVSVISLKWLHETNENVYITIPALKKLKLKNLSFASAEKFNKLMPDLELSNVGGFTASECTLSHFNLDLLHSVDKTDVTIEKSCKLDSMYIRMPGSGNLNLETTGKLQNRLEISEKVIVSGKRAFNY